MTDRWMVCLPTFGSNIWTTCRIVGKITSPMDTFPFWFGCPIFITLFTIVRWRGAGIKLIKQVCINYQHIFLSAYTFAIGTVCSYVFRSFIEEVHPVFGVLGQPHIGSRRKTQCRDMAMKKWGRPFS